MKETIRQDMAALVDEWILSDYLKADDLFVVGCSTSEVLGEHIGTHGSEEIAAIIFLELTRLKEEKGIHLAFQGCEHINRALVVEEEILKSSPFLEEVTVVPHAHAGGSMASFAYKTFKHPVVVEHISANAGIDIGDTMIGMHLKHVAVPLRMQQKKIGNAHLAAARTRPKLIGGQRAKYPESQ